MFSFYDAYTYYQPLVSFRSAAFSRKICAYSVDFQFSRDISYITGNQKDCSMYLFLSSTFDVNQNSELVILTIGQNAKLAHNESINLEQVRNIRMMFMCFLDSVPPGTRFANNLWAHNRNLIKCVSLLRGKWCSDQVTNLHMTRQLCSRDICKYMPWLYNQTLAYFQFLWALCEMETRATMTAAGITNSSTDFFAIQ